MLGKNTPETKYVNPQGQQLSAAFLQFLLPELQAFLYSYSFYRSRKGVGVGKVGFTDLICLCIYLSMADLALEIYKRSIRDNWEGSQTVVRSCTVCVSAANLNSQ